MNEEQKKTCADIYSDIIDALIAAEISESSTPRKFLESKGVDVDSLLASGLQIVNQWKNKTRLQTRRKQYENFRGRVQEFLSGLSQAPSESLREKLADVVAGGNKEVATAFWHKLEKLTDSDLQDMLKEQRLLEHFTQIYSDIDSVDET